MTFWRAAFTDPLVVAGLLKYARTASARPEPLPARGTVSESKGLAGATMACVITGHGLKDSDTALAIETELTEVAPEPSPRSTLSTSGSFCSAVHFSGRPMPTPFRRHPVPRIYGCLRKSDTGHIE